MRARQSALVDTGHHVQAFLDANAALIGTNILPARRNLNDAVTLLTTMATTQAVGVVAAKGATARQKALRATPRNNYMNAVTTVAKLLLADVPEIGTMEVEARNLNSTQLVATAHGMADAAGSYAAVFTQNGLPEDFIAQLCKAADAVTESVAGRQATQAITSGAVSGMRAQETRVRGLLKLINALVVPKLGMNAGLLARWKVVSRVRPQTPIPTFEQLPSAGTRSILSQLVADAAHSIIADAERRLPVRRAPLTPPNVTAPESPT
jgi:hypothetical protein